MVSLPPELYTAIFRELDDKATLYSLLFVSRLILSICEPLFYKSVQFIGRFHINRLDAYLRRILVDEGRLAKCVEELTFDTSDNHFLRNEDNIRVVRSIFNASTGLKRVRYNISSTATGLGATFDYMGRSFQLTHFIWTYNGHHQVDSSTLTGFLVAQPMIQHLELRFDSEVDLIVDLPDDALPHLSYLHAPALLAAVIIPGRKVSHLSLQSVFVDFNVTEGASNALKQIVSISLSDVFVSHSVIKSVLCCSNLRYLRILGDKFSPNALRRVPLFGIGRFRIRYAQVTAKSQRLEEDARSVLNNMPTLRVVDVIIEMDSKGLIAGRLHRFQRNEVATTVDINSSGWEPWCESLGLESVDMDDA